MAEQIISPGVFTRENDLSFLPAGVEAIGAAIVGPTVKGPAFHPTVVRSFAEYEKKFGPLSQDTFVPQTVREYIRNAGAVTVVRVLAGGGYTFTPATSSPIAIGVGNDRAECLITCTNAPDAGDTITLINSAGLTKVLVAHASATSGLTFSRAGANNGIDDLAAAIATNFGTTLTTSKPTATTLLITQQTPGIAGNTAVVETLANYTVTSRGMATSAFTGGTDRNITGVIYPAMHTHATPDLKLTVLNGGITSGAGISGSVSSSFAIQLKGTYGGAEAVAGTTYSASLNPANSDYLFKQLGYKPTVSKTGTVAFEGTPGYTYMDFKNQNTDFTGNVTATGYQAGNTSSVWIAALGTATVFDGGLGYTEGYSYASTPTITSGFINALKTTKELFTFHTLVHGTSTNKEYKISILNHKQVADIDNEEQYSTFSVQIRKYGDKDKSTNVLEQYDGCTLNPDSPTYIARKIGDRYSNWNSTLSKIELLGNFPNISDYVRVSVNEAVANKSTSPKLLPKGFKAVSNPIATTNWAVDVTEAPVIHASASYEGTQVVGTNYSSKGYLGWKFDDKKTDNTNFIKPVDGAGQANVAGAFNVDNYLGHLSSGLGTGSLSASIDATGATGPAASQLKFSVPFQGGFDGSAPYTPKFTGAESTLAGNYNSGTNLYGFDLSSTTATGYTAYKKALDILSNQDEYDINMLAMPGVIYSIHSATAAAGIDMVEERGDAFFVMDLCDAKKTVNAAVSAVSGLDSSHTAVYYPWVKVLDTSINKPVLVPPSVVVPGAIAKSDQIGQGEWFAPAGLNRGVLGTVIEAQTRLNQSERDRLYNDKINPIASFPGISNPVIWGQKTLQARATALDRINVRRLLIAVKKFIASSSKYLVFEANTTKTRQRFLNIANPYLESIQQRQGLFAFRVVMDGSNNTPDVIDRNQLVGGIYLQPTKTAEFIVLDFNILPTGATFPS